MKRRRASGLVPVVFLLFPGMGVLLPLGWVLLTAFTSAPEGIPGFFTLPSGTLEHFLRLGRETDFPLWFLHSLELAILNGGGALLLALPTGWALSRGRFSRQAWLFKVPMLLQLFPPFLFLVAIYVLLSRWGLLNSFLGLVLVYQTGQIPFTAWYMKGVFDNIPRDLDEAARLDGASFLQLVFYHLIPLGAPGLKVVALTAFTLPWFDFILQTMVLDGDNRTIAMGLAEWLRGAGTTDYPLFAAASVLVAVPMIILYSVLYRPGRRGPMEGGFKP